MTFIKYSVLVMMVVVVVLAAGCGTKDPLSPTTVKTDIMPLKIGNSWTYSMNWYSGPDTLAASYVYYMNVTDTTAIGGEKWYKTVLSVPSVPWVDTVFFINRENGLYFRMSTVVNDSVYMRFKYPAAVGDTYSAAFEFLVGEFYLRSNPAELISTGISTAVPFSTLSCYFQTTNLAAQDASHPKLDDYFRPNMGMLKSTWWAVRVSELYIHAEWELTAISLQ